MLQEELVILYLKTSTKRRLIEIVGRYIYLTPGYLKQKKFESKQVREDYFEPITQDGIDRFMNLDIQKRVSNA